MQDLQTPEWDLDSEYPGLESSELKADQARVQALIADLQALGPGLIGDDVMNTAQKMALLQKEAEMLLYNITSYTYLKRSTDLKNSQARTLYEQFRKLGSQLSQAVQPLQQFVLRTSESVFEQFLQHPELADSHFFYRHQRQNRDRLLPLEQEQLLTSLELEGFQTWGNLYTNLAGSVDVEITNAEGETESVGVARLLSLLGDKEDSLRQRAFQGLNQVFTTHQETCAAILNALAGWRLEVAQRRSHTIETNFLTSPLYSNRMQPQTLETMMEVAFQQRELSQHVLKLQARLMGKDQLDPWDSLAPAPELGEASPLLSYPEAMDLIVEAFQEIHPEMGRFARLMQEQNWIDAAAQAHKAPGAFCSGFAKSRTPRVLMTYLGSHSNLITLAHEIGHAFHSWVMREMPRRETRYPMSLAETASTFAETVVRHRLLELAPTPAARLAILWQEVSAIPRFLINIPVRYRFEQAFYQQRSSRTLGPDDFKQLMAETWNDWHGDSMSAADEMFWASKMHFYITDPSFYNFPYTFGYLFSQAIYAERAKRGEGFFDFYTALLRDTGRMTVEQLAEKHFQQSISAPAFWEPCIAILQNYAQQFEALIKELGH